MQALCAAIPDTRDTRQLLDAVVRGAAAFFRADAAVVFLSGEQGLIPTSWVGLQPQLVQRRGVPASNGLREYMDRFMSPGRCVHFLSAPLVMGDRSFGEIALCSSRRERSSYGRSDRELLNLLAQRTAVAIDKVEALERAERQKGAIARIARAIARETECRKVAEATVEIAVSELDADVAVVWTSNNEERILELLAITGVGADVVRSLERMNFDSPNPAAVAASTLEAQLVQGLDEMWGSEVTRQLFDAAGVQSLVDVPLVAQGKLMGVLSFARKSRARWSAGERTLIVTVGDLLASAILSARLSEQQMAARREFEQLTARLTSINEQLVQANIRSAEMADLAQQRATELEATIANIADAVYVCDPEGRILMINDTALSMIGVGRSEVEPSPLKEFLTGAKIRYPDGRPIPEERLAISRALRGEVVRGMEEVIFDAKLRRDRYIIASAAPIRDTNGKMLGAVEVHGDITRLKELDILKDQFITVAAHEIKTPVTAIKGYAQSLLRSQTEIDAKYRAALETIVRQSDRIDALVRDFLEIARMRQGDLTIAREPVDLTALVSRVVERMLPGTAKHRVFLSRRDPAWVEGEHERLEEVMMNLLENAMRYSPWGGDVEVRISRDDHQAVVSVSDQGVGIPEARRSNVFERFYRAHIGTSLDYGGLGVGLYISREIVRRHGGEMWFDTREGEGSTFYFSLPLARDGETPS